MNRKLLMILIMATLFSNCKSVKKIYRTEISELFNHQRNEKVLSEENLKHLPQCVQNYIRYSGWKGKTIPLNCKMHTTGKFKMGKKKNFIPIKTEQYNFFEITSRFFYIKNMVVGGRDKYYKQKGNMLIKLFQRFKVGEVSGHFMDESGLVTYLNDICLIAPFELIKKEYSWKEIDDYSAEVTLTDGKKTATATLIFNEQYQMVNFITDDRYYAPNDKNYKKVKWSTPVNEYFNQQGINIPKQADAIWHFPDEDFHYIRMTVDKVVYNNINQQ